MNITKKIGLKMWLNPVKLPDNFLIILRGNKNTNTYYRKHNIVEWNFDKENIFANVLFNYDYLLLTKYAKVLD